MNDHDLLDRIRVLEEQLATLLDRTGATVETGRPSGSIKRGTRRERQGRRPGDRKEPAGQTKRSGPASQPSARNHASLPGPTRIPGVRIVCIGARPDAIEGIRAYWQGRGAKFEARDTVETSLHVLDQRLARADVVFICAERVGAEAIMRLQRYCDQTEKPLVPLNEADMYEPALAIGSRYPLA